MSENRICYYVDPTNRRWFVGMKPGAGGKDWGWVFHASEARRLSPYWQRRFKNWCQHMNRVPCFI